MLRGPNPKKIGFLDWIWMGNPKPEKIQKSKKIQNSNPKKIQKSMKMKIQTQIQNPIIFGFLNSKFS
jgi:beta-lactamase regulating signal transducer with metallopeptidase domain